MPSPLLEANVLPFRSSTTESRLHLIRSSTDSLTSSSTSEGSQSGYWLVGYDRGHGHHASEPSSLAIEDGDISNHHIFDSRLRSALYQ
ncbi:unnamed protein product [Taenia asiatica]|uniref:Uncharacterized protein n=1 Tax=Taenia asiatica TaxID=60517 RepID=A0A0R3WEG6_TAEAS|nr:unnamed protein product [Taenia asiatica]